MGLQTVMATVIVVAGIAAAGVCYADDASPSVHSWMSEAELRARFVGGGFEGYYADSSPWAETYYPDGSITYRDKFNDWTGTWSFRSNVFCTFYNEGANGGCFLIEQLSENCFEFYVVEGEADESLPTGSEPLFWNARGWRTDRPSTCEPYVGA